MQIGFDYFVLNYRRYCSI